ncbi:MAG: hypothetical protein KC468_24425, partial [Myxococcales bacterium]|nr:hypothetical protein [Myxococcales bacterium]
MQGVEVSETRGFWDPASAQTSWSGGLALRFEGRALYLEGAPRELGPGARLERFEVEVTGVEFPLAFPLEWSGDAAAFRGRTCRASWIAIEWTSRALRQRGRELLIGRTLARGDAARSIVEVEFAVHDGPTLELELTLADARGGWGALLLDLELDVCGHHLTLRPASRCAMGPLAEGDASLWRRLLRELSRAPGFSLVADEDDEDHDDDEVAGLAIDPVFCALAGPWLAAGWKPPMTCGAFLQPPRASDRGVQLVLRREPLEHRERDAGPPTPVRRLADILARARAARAAGDGETLADIDAELVDALRWLRPATRRVLLRERVALWRGLDATRAWEALAARVTACPEELVPRRALALALARSGEHRVLATRLAAWAHRPQQSAPERWRRRLAWGEALLACGDVDEARRVLEPLGAVVESATSTLERPGAR